MSLIPQIVTVDSVWTITESKIAQLINDELSYVEEFWVPTGIGNKKERMERTIRLIEARGNGEYWFHTGFLDIVLYFLDRNKIQYEYIDESKQVAYDEPNLPNIEFREYQSKLINIALEKGRGVIKAPTATGKSVILAGIMSAFSQEKILFLVHTVDLVVQMKKHLEKYELGPTTQWNTKKKEKSRIIVATIQGFCKSASSMSDYFDVVVVDEGHHVSTFKGQYAKTLGVLDAPAKFAVTATMPYKPEAKLALEAFIGPLIGEYTIEEANEDGYLAKPEITILTSPYVPDDLLLDASELYCKPGTKPTVYRVVYWNGIVKNFNRNLMILDTADIRVNQGKTVLINIINKAHGDELMDMINDLEYDWACTYVNGSSKDREEVIAGLEKKELDVVIATKVFNEGVDIQSLNCCINGAGGKSEIETLQKIGRGLRKTEGKDVLEFIDFMDECHPILLGHSNKRIHEYTKMGWM